MHSAPDLKLDWCSTAAAQYAVRRWHYSRSLPTPPLVRIGVWEHDYFIGVVLFSRGANRYLLAPYELTAIEGAELTRIALAPHQAPVSMILSKAIKMLKAHSPGLRLLISFADPAHGHVGTVYQASNWIYAGTTSETTLHRSPDGKLWRSRMIAPSGIKKVYGQRRRVWKPDQCTAITQAGKHRYCSHSMIGSKRESDG